MAKKLSELELQHQDLEHKDRPLAKELSAVASATRYGTPREVIEQMKWPKKGPEPPQ
jgi:hypothetical protein